MFESITRKKKKNKFIGLKFDKCGSQLGDSDICGSLFVLVLFVSVLFVCFF